MPTTSASASSHARFTCGRRGAGIHELQRDRRRHPHRDHMAIAGEAHRELLVATELVDDHDLEVCERTIIHQDVAVGEYEDSHHCLPVGPVALRMCSHSEADGSCMSSQARPSTFGQPYAHARASCAQRGRLESRRNVHGGTMQDPADEFAGVAERIADHAQALNVRVAVAESLSSGGIANTLGAAPEASEWFTGGVVAYAESVKRGVLGVTAEVITSAQCARELATGVAKLLGAEAAVAVTGVGGPQSVDGLPPGTVFIAVACLRDDPRSAVRLRGGCGRGRAPDDRPRARALGACPARGGVTWLGQAPFPIRRRDRR